MHFLVHPASSPLNSSTRKFNMAQVVAGLELPREKYRSHNILVNKDPWWGARVAVMCVVLDIWWRKWTGVSNCIRWSGIMSNFDILIRRPPSAQNAQLVYTQPLGYTKQGVWDSFHDYWELMYWSFAHFVTLLINALAHCTCIERVSENSE